MSKRQEAKYKISRRYGVNLWGRDKDPFNTKNYLPGQHGPTGRRRMPSDFGTQLRAKQLLKGYYANISEKKFRSIFKAAAKRKGDTGENLIGLLEQRLDVIVYRANFVPTMFAARQFVNHKHVTVNGKPVNIPSYQVQPGDIVQVKEKSRTIPMVVEAVEKQETDVPEYIDVSRKDFKASLIRIPAHEEVPYATEMDTQLVIEFYSR